MWIIKIQCKSPNAYRIMQTGKQCSVLIQKQNTPARTMHYYLEFTTVLMRTMEKDGVVFLYTCYLIVISKRVSSSGGDQILGRVESLWATNRLKNSNSHRIHCKHSFIYLFILLRFFLFYAEIIQIKPWIFLQINLPFDGGIMDRKIFIFLKIVLFFSVSSDVS